MTDEARNMFDSIVDLVDAETGSNESPSAEETTEKPKRKAGEGNQKSEKPRKPAQSISRSSRAPTTTQIDDSSRPELLRAHSKARVQKSVRFRPALIAELDEHLRSLEIAGQERSIQDVMNEALELWLDKNKGRRPERERQY